MEKVVFDSSFLMAIVESPTAWNEDILEAIGKFQPILLDCVKEELGRLAAAGDGKARLARVALGVASGFEIDSCGSASVDDEILSASASTGAIVATVDSDLTRSALAAHLRVITLRKGRVALV